MFCHEKSQLYISGLAKTINHSPSSSKGSELSKKSFGLDVLGLSSKICCASVYVGQSEHQFFSNLERTVLHSLIFISFEALHGKDFQ